MASSTSVDLQSPSRQHEDHEMHSKTVCSPAQRPPQTNQPVGTSTLRLMPAPAQMQGIPPGLEYLAQIDQLLIHQQVELFEVLTGFETCNKYRIKNVLGQQVYFAGEESGCCERYWCGPLRGFLMHITDNVGREVIRIDRQFKCCGYGYPACAGMGCCAVELHVEAPVGVIVGYVRQQKSCTTIKCAIEDAEKQPVFVIEGPWCCACQAICCPEDLEYKILTADGDHEIGIISKQWAGCCKEHFTDADNFGLTFPLDLDVRMKATLIGAVFLIDYWLFEANKNNNSFAAL